MDKEEKSSEIQNQDESTENEIGRCISLEHRIGDVMDGEFCSPLRNTEYYDSSKRTMQYIPGRGFSKYDNALRNLIPLRPKLKKQEAMPIDNVGLFSFITFSWLSKYMWKAFRQGITLKDLPAVSPYDGCEYNGKRLELLWNEELSKFGHEKASLTSAAWKFIRTRIYISCSLYTASLILGFIAPTLLMRRLLIFVQTSDGNIQEGIKWALLLTLSEFIRILIFSSMWAMNYRTALRLRSACLIVCYRKIIRLNNLGNKSIGELLNVFSNDSQRVFDMVILGPMVIGGPIVTICGVFYILWILSPMALLGMIAFLIFYPCQYIISRTTSYYRGKAVKVGDSRIRLMNEILQCIKLIKMYAWERRFSEDLIGIRKQEQSLLLKTAYFQSLSVSLAPTVPVISAIVTFLSHIAAGNNLTAAEVFPLLTFLNSQLRNTFNILQMGVANIFDAMISFRRFKSLLLLEEGNCLILKPTIEAQAVGIVHGTFVCTFFENQEDKSTGSKRKKKKKVHTNQKSENEETERLRNSVNVKRIEVLQDISFEASKGQLIGICGHVGSGKSSLLLAALGQLRIHCGQVMRDGSCAFVSQEAWIINATLRENILFGEPFESTRYYKALLACSLGQDLNMLPGGDQTEIGERGINLSGGQKQRVALARAFYADRDIYLLDDPLSAVDAHVGIHIFDNLILDALKDKTVLFVTHQVQYLNRCDDIYMLREGRIVEHGTHGDLMKLDKEYAMMIKTIQAESESNLAEQENSEPEETETGGDKVEKLKSIDRTLSSNSQANVKAPEKVENAGTVLMVPDKVERGSVKAHTYHMYVISAGGYFACFLVVLAFFFNIGSTAFSNWWLANWLKIGGGNETVIIGNETIPSNNINDNPDFNYYQTVYASCIVVILVTSLLRGLAITQFTINASTTLHNAVFKKIIQAPMKFFETTPSGRIQNMFSRDMDEVDTRLPITLEGIIQNTFIVLFAVLFICMVFPWFTIPLIFLAALYYFINAVFRVAIRDLRRIENSSRSPIFSFLMTTTQGLSTIRAFDKQNECLAKFQELFDLNNSSSFLCNIAMRWLAVRFDGLAVLSISITGFFVIGMKDQVSPALAGLALTYCAHISGVFQYYVRLISEADVRFISVENIEHYIKTLESEEQKYTKTNRKLPVNWPTRGEIKFRNVQMRYRTGLPLVLNGITCTITAGEKIGIVGRTGSGKSSVTVALFRLVELAGGKIKIDDVDITTTSLDLLRSKLSIVPQDPILFSGSIRSNLDPFKIHEDTEIWEALEKTKLKSRIESVSAQLNAPVGFGGDNLSMGEKQLLCLTRALLRRSKILVLDEATAAVDPETEIAVQNTIQQEFSGCTVLTIAHRLQTVQYCDRILLMNNGMILEFDTPTNLLSNPYSEFSMMMAAAEKAVRGC
ncbi:multidrug resistance-associated protein 5 isoform X1 [Cephus cinctus]|uniref:Multidrug resistance-associated protein 5 isoform X1 n=2 Tax=Cephus cinctus TaxID=211228 RepID=A0AAJ7RCR3_CEPCN|nr:multidrug resistance-associated protein 5 isoform X1 [Cephus cinctus]XP_024938068.1 multidrug resistance-associated protein 5 isoform X1 [Cephus cinctus]XP_024938070.1 multidrug resistance-associated protein 5 isoform X1 [Cephus cinctus]XP_024938071.1 multidrug resistance-associated protein 5 isoform X1 [Cephus cinctus]